jgi:hypothetical protein
MYGYGGGAMLMLIMSVSGITAYKQTVLPAFQTVTIFKKMET